VAAVDQPTDLRGEWNRAITSYQDGDLDAALLGMRTIVARRDQVADQEGEALVASALLNVGGILDKKGQSRAALAAYDSAIDYCAEKPYLAEGWAVRLDGIRKRRDWLAARRRKEQRAGLLSISIYGAVAALWIWAMRRSPRRRTY
jgi:hypothetical protein